MLAMLARIGAQELLIILAIVLLVFGSTKLPQLARSLGRAKGEFEKGIREDDARDEPKESSEA